MDDPYGSIDEREYPWDYFSGRFKSWADELSFWVERVLKKYYGDEWSDSSAKVILIGHSPQVRAFSVREQRRYYALI